ncbi:MAG: ABC transporter substrate-binding protein [Flavobacteriales bacterium]|nr:ABC transporter substrate-binding protein [Flavobacteriales bacterium]
MNIRSGFFLFFIFLLSCGTPLQDENLSIFRYNQSSGIATLDPAFAKDQATIWACNQLFSGLVQLNEKLEVTPSIAKNWEISENGLLYTFHLRNNVFFHNHKLFKGNRTVVATDFSYSFNRLRSKELAAPGAWVLANVKNYKAINDTTFEIKLKKPFPPFLGLLSMQYCSVVPKEIIENSNFREHPIGTGPFQFQYWKDGVKLVFRKNQNYFEKVDGKQLPFLDAVSITFIKDKQAAFLEFLKGKLDFISGIDASYKDELLNRNGTLKTKYKDKIILQSQPYLNTEYLGFLMKDPPPIEIRKAINYGFDRVKMLKYLRNNIGTPALQGFVPKGLPSFSEKLKGYNFNPEEAKQLIAESNFDKKKEIILSTTSSYLDLCEYIQNSLSEIDLKIMIEVNPPSTHRQMVATSKLAFFRGSWIADYADAENYLALFYSRNFCPNGPNYTHFRNNEYDNLYEKAAMETTDSSRFELYKQMDKMIIEQAVIVPLYYDRVLRFTKPNISGFNSNAMNLLDLKRVRKRKSIKKL